MNYRAGISDDIRAARYGLTELIEQIDRTIPMIMKCTEIETTDKATRAESERRWAGYVSMLQMFVNHCDVMRTATYRVNNDLFHIAEMVKEAQEAKNDA